jgi:hypothetical protein
MFEIIDAHGHLAGVAENDMKFMRLPLLLSRQKVAIDAKLDDVSRLCGQSQFCVSHFVTVSAELGGAIFNAQQKVGKPVPWKSRQGGLVNDLSPILHRFDRYGDATGY